MGNTRRTFTMYSHHVFPMCPPELPGGHFKCSHDVPTGQETAVIADHILNVLVDLITIIFQVYLECNHDVPARFSTGKLRQNLNTKNARVEVGLGVEVEVGLRVGLELSWAGRRWVGVVGVWSAFGRRWVAVV